MYMYMYMYMYNYTYTCSLARTHTRALLSSCPHSLPLPRLLLSLLPASCAPFVSRLSFVSRPPFPPWPELLTNISGSGGLTFCQGEIFKHRRKLLESSRPPSYTILNQSEFEERTFLRSEKWSMHARTRTLACTDMHARTRMHTRTRMHARTPRTFTVSFLLVGRLPVVSITSLSLSV